MLVWHMTSRTKRMRWLAPTMDARKKVVLDAFHNGGYVEVGHISGNFRGDALMPIAGKRPTETGDIITDGNHIWEACTNGPDFYLGVF